MALRDLLRLKRNVNKLPDDQDYDFKDSCEYVLAKSTEAYENLGYTAVAKRETNFDGTMYLLERKRA